MPRFVALLRGVNVGNGNRLPVADFKVLLESLGYEDVHTLLNSGKPAAPADVTGDSSVLGRGGGKGQLLCCDWRGRHGCGPDGDTETRRAPPDVGGRLLRER